MLRILTNFVNFFVCFVQIQLLQTLSAENLKLLSTCSLSAPLNESAKTPSDSSVSPEDVFRERFDKIDSGFESARTNLTTKFSKAVGGISNLNRGRTPRNADKPPGVENEVPWEVFLTGRKLTAAVYSRIPLDEKPAERELRSKPNLPGRGKIAQVKPVLRVELVHPALIVNTQSSGPRIQVSCFDVSVAGTSPTTGKKVGILNSNLIFRFIDRNFIFVPQQVPYSRPSLIQRITLLSGSRAGLVSLILTVVFYHH